MVVVGSNELAEERWEIRGDAEERRGCKEMGEMTTVKYQSLLHLGTRRIRESLTAGWKRRGELPSLSTNELCKSSGSVLRRCSGYTHIISTCFYCYFL